MEQNEHLYIFSEFNTAPGISMEFHSARLLDADLVQLEPAHDKRSFFARTFCVEECAAHGLETSFPQHSISFSARKGTLRGRHYQRDPRSEAKLVRCSRGAILDVIRPTSPTYRRGRNSSFRARTAAPTLHSEGVHARFPNT